MAITFFDRRIEITLDEFPNGLAPDVFEQSLRESSSSLFDGMEVSGQRNRNGHLTDGLCTVRISRKLLKRQQTQFRGFVAQHLGGDPLQEADQRLEDLEARAFGHSTIRYIRRAPKTGEDPNAGTGTHVYRDQNGNWRRLTDDEILRAAP